MPFFSAMFFVWFSWRHARAAISFFLKKKGEFYACLLSCQEKAPDTKRTMVAFFLSPPPPQASGFRL